MPALIEIPASAAGSWKPGVQESADLPASGNALYDVRASADDSVLFMWNGTTWLSTAGGGGSFNNPAITGTLNFNSSLMKITDASDRTRFLGDVYEFNNAANTRSGLFINIDTVHPQFTTEGMDIWFEGGTGGAVGGSLVWLAKDGRIGWSQYQQDDLPGFHMPIDVALKNNLLFVAAGDASTATLTSNLAQLSFNGGLISGDKQLNFKNIESMTWKNTVNDHYVELYLGLSSIYKLQTNVDVWINDSKFVSYSSAANKARAGTATLSGGTVTVANITITTKTKILLSYNTEAGTPGRLSAPTRTAATSFVIQSSSGTDTSTVDWFLLEVET